jgi:soluble lytic murein transglycosylase-like protein
MINKKHKRKNVKKNVNRINQYNHLFEIYGKKYGVGKNLTKAIAYVETRGRHYDSSGKIIVSSAGALGFMQLMPKTAEWLRVDPHVLWQNIKGGIKQLGINLKHYNGDIVPAITAYNAGIGTTDYLTKKAESDNFLDYRESTTNEEIKGYTLKVLAAKKIFDDWENLNIQ